MVDSRETGTVRSIIAYYLEDCDLYLRLSLIGLLIFVVLCCMIFCAWHHYGSVISTVLSPANKLGPSVSSQDSWTLGRSSSYYVPWQQEIFPLSPETRKLDKATRKNK